VIKRSDLGFLLEGYLSILLALPLFHQYGHWAMHATVYMAGNMLLVPDPRDAEMMAELMRKYRPSFNIAVPTQFMKLLQKVDQTWEC
jgi:acyl-CoA synthetase (AMP-forming)/AMP-acid ligase II